VARYSRMMSRKSSGSMFADNADELTMSQKSTVSWRRSASSWLEVCWGPVFRRALSVDCASARLWAHCPQNSKLAGLLDPQLGHRRLSGVAHWPQNLIPLGFSNPHCSHCMAESSYDG